MKSIKQKHILITLNILLFIVIACSSKSKSSKGLTIDDVTVDYISSDLSIITIDKCEYVKYIGTYGGGITHKGNCKNPIHFNK